MATTTNYGWTTPDNTDLVKDGALAIRTLGSAIDTSVYTALGGNKAGLVLLNTTSFSAVANQQFNNVFSSTYDNYRINLVYVPSTGLNLTLRLRDSGAITAANYAYQFLVTDSATGAVYSNNANGRTQTSANISNTGALVRATIAIDMFSPFLSETTQWRLQGTNTVANHHNASGSYNASTSATGFEINTSTGNVTGVCQIFGYNQ